jgi:hypothetical protein
MTPTLFARWFSSMETAIQFAESVMDDCHGRRIVPLVQLFSIKGAVLVTVKT